MLKASQEISSILNNNLRPEYNSTIEQCQLCTENSTFISNNKGTD